MKFIHSTSPQNYIVHLYVQIKITVPLLMKHFE